MGGQIGARLGTVQLLPCLGLLRLRPPRAPPHEQDAFLQVRLTLTLIPHQVQRQNDSSKKEPTAVRPPHAPLYPEIKETGAGKPLPAQ